MAALENLTLRPGSPDISDLPWELPLQEWGSRTTRLEEVARGLSRHAVVFVNYDGQLYAVKELPGGLAKNEYDRLSEIERLQLPAVTPVGYIQIGAPGVLDSRSFLITRYLDRSLPYRSLFIHTDLDRYREHLLDAMAGLLVQLHLAGVYWGDCSLSNTLFRRDAGTLRAYLVDAETAEFYPPRLSPTLRHHDLQIMEEEVDGDLSSLIAAHLLAPRAPILETGASIRQRYQRLWEEITHDLVLTHTEHYRIQERVRALNALGFSVGEIAIQPTQDGEKLRLRIMVTDRNFHRNQLFGLTGLAAEESQARQMINEIVELQAMLSRDWNRSTPLSAAAYYWLEKVYRPVVSRLEPLAAAKAASGESPSLAELYCQVLEHKWYLSERAQHDVGHLAAVDDFLHKFGQGG
jgi:hypothetical protein